MNKEKFQMAAVKKAILQELDDKAMGSKFTFEIQKKAREQLKSHQDLKESIFKFIDMCDHQKGRKFKINSIPYPHLPKDQIAVLKKGLDLEPGHAQIMAGLFNPKLDESLLRQHFSQA